jgi:hypothetical protein
VLISLSSLGLSPSLSRNNFMGLMRGMYSSLLKELPVVSDDSVLAVGRIKIEKLSGRIYNCLNQPGFSQAISINCLPYEKGNRILLYGGELACFIFGSWRFKISSQGLRKLLRDFSCVSSVRLDECCCCNLD